jgi:hypothetical protein
MEKRAQKKNLTWTGTRLVCYKAIKKERKNTWQRKEQEKNKRKDQSPNKRQHSKATQQVHIRYQINTGTNNQARASGWVIHEG